MKAIIICAHVNIHHRNFHATDQTGGVYTTTSSSADEAQSAAIAAPPAGTVACQAWGSNA